MKKKHLSPKEEKAEQRKLQLLLILALSLRRMNQVAICFQFNMAENAISRRCPKQCVFCRSDSDLDLEDLSRDDLVKYVIEKEELLKMKHEELRNMQDKVLRTYAEMENVMERTRREAENTKKFAIQVSFVSTYYATQARLIFGSLTCTSTSLIFV